MQYFIKEATTKPTQVDDTQMLIHMLLFYCYQSTLLHSFFSVSQLLQSSAAIPTGIQVLPQPLSQIFGRSYATSCTKKQENLGSRHNTCGGFEKHQRLQGRKIFKVKSLAGWQSILRTREDGNRFTILATTSKIRWWWRLPLQCWCWYHRWRWARMSGLWCS